MASFHHLDDRVVACMDYREAAVLYAVLRGTCGDYMSSPWKHACDLREALYPHAKLDTDLLHITSARHGQLRFENGCVEKAFVKYGGIYLPIDVEDVEDKERPVTLDVSKQELMTLFLVLQVVADSTITRSVLADINRSGMCSDFRDTMENLRIASGVIGFKPRRAVANP